MAVFIGILIALLSIVVVMLPFLRGRRRVIGRAFFEPIDETIKERESIYEAMKTLSLDYQMGNVSDEDFNAQIQAYRLQAAQVLMEQDHLMSLEGEIEQQVLDFRKSLGNRDNIRLCLECDNPLSAEVHSCPNCGAEVEGS